MTGIATSAASSRARNASSVMYYSVYLCRERHIPNRSKTSDLGLPFPVPWPFPKCYTTTIAAPARFSGPVCASVRSGCSSPIPGRLSAFTRHGHIHGRCYSYSHCLGCCCRYCRCHCLRKQRRQQPLDQQVVTTITTGFGGDRVTAAAIRRDNDGASVGR